MYQYKSLFILAFASIIMVSGCEKIIEIELNETEQNVVIEATLENQPGNNQVLLTRTASFYEVNEFEQISGAEVTLSDQSGNAYLLTEQAPGVYQHDSLTGIAGQTYSLEIQAENQTYTAVSTLPGEVTIDSVSATLREPPIGDPGYQVFAHFTDPVETQDFYRLKIYNPNQPTLEYQIFNDELFNGRATSLALFQTLFQSDEEVIVELMRIDQATFNYFNALLDITSNMGPGVAAPANPESNLTNNALGYFSAYGVARQVYLVP